MLVDTLNVVGVPLPPATMGAVPSSSVPPSEMERWADATRREGDGQAIDTQERVERWTQHFVNVEYARSRESGWRRLLPSACADYRPFLDPGRTLNGLDFDV